MQRHCRTLVRRFAVVMAAAGLAGAWSVGAGSPKAAPGPSPTVIGPIPATAPPGDPSHDYPFFSSTRDLGSRGYIEEEYFLEGTASRFDIPASLADLATPLPTATVVETGLPYRTRLMVRRPTSATAFNGTVVMEWQNAAFGFDIDAVWAASAEHLVRRGYVWIGVSVMRVSVHGSMGLRAWSPARYGMLDVTADGTLLDDSLAYDIFSQAARAVRDPLGTDPLAGLRVERLVAAGISQGAARLVAYQNGVQPLAGLFDGFMPVVGGSTVRADSDARTFKVLSETDVARNQAAIRQPNTSRFRRWEIAGASHVPFTVAQVIAPLMARDLGSSMPGTCDATPFSRVPFEFAFNASLDAMVSWIEEGIEPPIADDIEVAAIGLPGFFTADIARDGLGNALGGLRLAEHAVPTAANTGINAPVTTACRTYGSYAPFDQAILGVLYPDHGTYVSEVVQVTQDNVKAGFIVREDAATTIVTAARSAIGRR